MENLSVKWKKGVSRDYSRLKKAKRDEKKESTSSTGQKKEAASAATPLTKQKKKNSRKLASSVRQKKEGSSCGLAFEKGCPLSEGGAIDLENHSPLDKGDSRHFAKTECLPVLQDSLSLQPNLDSRDIRPMPSLVKETDNRNSSSPELRKLKRKLSKDSLNKDGSPSPKKSLKKGFSKGIADDLYIPPLFAEPHYLGKKRDELVQGGARNRSNSVPCLPSYNLRNKHPHLSNSSLDLKDPGSDLHEEKKSREVEPEIPDSEKTKTNGFEAKPDHLKPTSGVKVFNCKRCTKKMSYLSHTQYCSFCLAQLARKKKDAAIKSPLKSKRRKMGPTSEVSSSKLQKPVSLKCTKNLAEADPKKQVETCIKSSVSVQSFKEIIDKKSDDPEAEDKGFKSDIRNSKEENFKGSKLKLDNLEQATKANIFKCKRCSRKMSYLNKTQCCTFCLAQVAREKKDALTKSPPKSKRKKMKSTSDVSPGKLHESILPIKVLTVAVVHQEMCIKPESFKENIDKKSDDPKPLVSCKKKHSSKGLKIEKAESPIDRESSNAFESHLDHAVSPSSISPSNDNLKTEEDAGSLSIESSQYTGSPAPIIEVSNHQAKGSKRKIDAFNSPSSKESVVAEQPDIVQRKSKKKVKKTKKSSSIERDKAPKGLSSVKTKCVSGDGNLSGADCTSSVVTPIIPAKESNSPLAVGPEIQATLLNDKRRDQGPCAVKEAKNTHVEFNSSVERRTENPKRKSQRRKLIAGSKLRNSENLSPVDENTDSSKEIENSSEEEKEVKNTGEEFNSNADSINEKRKSKRGKPQNCNDSENPSRIDETADSCKTTENSSEDVEEAKNTNIEIDSNVENLNENSKRKSKRGKLIPSSKFQNWNDSENSSRIDETTNSCKKSENSSGEIKKAKNTNIEIDSNVKSLDENPKRKSKRRKIIASSEFPNCNDLENTNNGGKSRKRKSMRLEKSTVKQCSPASKCIENSSQVTNQSSDIENKSKSMISEAIILNGEVLSSLDASSKLKKTSKERKLREKTTSKEQLQPVSVTENANLGKEVMPMGNEKSCSLDWSRTVPPSEEVCEDEKIGCTSNPTTVVPSKIIPALQVGINDSAKKGGSSCLSSPEKYQVTQEGGTSIGSSSENSPTRNTEERSKMGQVNIALSSECKTKDVSQFQEIPLKKPDSNGVEKRASKNPDSNGAVLGLSSDEHATLKELLNSTPENAIIVRKSANSDSEFLCIKCGLKLRSLTECCWHYSKCNFQFGEAQSVALKDVSWICNRCSSNFDSKKALVNHKCCSAEKRDSAVLHGIRCGSMPVPVQRTLDVDSQTVVSEGCSQLENLKDCLENTIAVAVENNDSSTEVDMSDNVLEADSHDDQPDSNFSPQISSVCTMQTRGEDGESDIKESKPDLKDLVKFEEKFRNSAENEAGEKSFNIFNEQPLAFDVVSQRIPKYCDKCHQPFKFSTKDLDMKLKVRIVKQSKLCFNFLAICRNCDNKHFSNFTLPVVSLEDSFKKVFIDYMTGVDKDADTTRYFLELCKVFSSRSKDFYALEQSFLNSKEINPGMNADLLAAYGIEGPSNAHSLSQVSNTSESPTGLDATQGALLHMPLNFQEQNFPGWSVPQVSSIHSGPMNISGVSMPSTFPQHPLIISRSMDAPGSSDVEVSAQESSSHVESSGLKISETFSQYPLHLSGAENMFRDSESFGEPLLDSWPSSSVGDLKDCAVPGTSQETVSHSELYNSDCDPYPSDSWCDSKCSLISRVSKNASFNFIKNFDNPDIYEMGSVHCCSFCFRSIPKDKVSEHYFLNHDSSHLKTEISVFRFSSHLK